MGTLEGHVYIDVLQKSINTSSLVNYLHVITLTHDARLTAQRKPTLTASYPEYGDRYFSKVYIY